MERGKRKREKETADLDRGFKLEKVGLSEKDFFGDGAEETDLGLHELNLLRRPCMSELQQSVYYIVQNRRLYGL